MAVKCIDVSKHNGVIDWNKVKGAGIEAVIIRAGYGCNTDPRFTTYIKGAQAAGIAVGVYWFAYPLNKAGAIKEAEYAQKVIKPYKLDLGVWYDFEYDTERYATQNNVYYNEDLRTEVIKAFCDRMKKYGHCVGIYLNPDYINKTNYNELKSYDLWLAQWPNGEHTAFSKVSPNNVNKKWGTPEIWQIGCDKIEGINGYTDINYYYGNVPEQKEEVKKVNYFSKPSYNGLSFVDALRIIKAPTTYTYRKKIAAKNGINNYTGTAQQNTELLNKLKQGKLIKP